MDASELKRIGKYEIKHPLKSGGMGTVYLAEDERIGRQVAIKTLTAGFAGNSEMLKLFYREARAGFLQHPNIVTIYDLGDEDGMPFIVMEFAEGKDLKDIIESQVPLPLLDKLSIIDQVLGALGYAHLRGVVHRDIKPANVIVQREPVIVVKLVDFGIAKVQSAVGITGLTGTGKHFGTLHYLSPERLRGQNGDGRVDIWATGVMLYLLLTGHLPFPGGEDAVVINRILNEPYPPLSNYLASYPPALDAILSHAIAKNPDERYATAEEFSADLHALIDTLKKEQIGELLSDSERLNQAQQFAQARDLLNQIVKLDPQNTSARQMLSTVNQSLARQRRVDRVRELLAVAHGAMEAGRFIDALNCLDEAAKEDPDNPEIKAKFDEVRARKQCYEEVESCMTRAETLRTRGDLTGALAEVERALRINDQDTRVRAAYSEISRQVRLAQQQEEVRKLLGQAKTEMAAGRFTGAVEHLRAIAGIDPESTEAQRMLQTALVAQEEDRRRKILEQIHLEIDRLIDAGDWERAADFLDRALEKLPSEASLLSLKTKVALQLKKLRLKQQIDAVVAQAQETFLHAPAEALLIVQRAAQELGSDERLSALEATLRERLQSAEKEEMRSRYLHEAQAAIDRNQYEKAVEILESYQLEFSDAAGVGELLELARGESAQQQRRARIANAATQAKALIESEQYAQAIKILDPVHTETGDPALARLLADCRSNLTGLERRTDALLDRVGRLRARGAYKEAIGLLQGHAKADERGSKIATLLAEIRTENDRQEARKAALEMAAKAAENLEFASAIEHIEKVQRAWGSAPELANAIKEIDARRSQHATDVVSGAVQSARASLLADDPDGALKELRAAEGFCRFAGSALEADWRRLESEATNLQASRRRKAAAEARSSKKPAVSRIAGIAVAAIVVLAAAGGLVWHFTHGANPSKPQTQTAPGGQQPFVPPPPPPPAETTKSATIMIQGNVGGADVYVDNTPRAFTNPDGSLQLSVNPGAHTIRISKPGYTDSPVFRVTVAQNDQKAIRYDLTQSGPAAPPDPTAYVAIHTNPGTSISVNNNPQGVSDDQGDLVVKVQPGSYTLSFAKPNYQNLSQNFSVKAGARDNMTIYLTPVVVKAPDAPLVVFSASAGQVVQGQSATLNWSTSNTSDVDIEPGIGHVDANGQTSVSPQSPTTYTLTARGPGGTLQRTVSIGVTPKPEPVAPPSPPVTPPPPPNPAVAIRAALTSFYAAFNAHDVGKMRAIWTGMSAKDSKQFEQTFKEVPSMKITYNCPASGLSVSGDTADWVCSETTSYVSDGKPASTTRQEKFQLAKTGTGWTITDRH